MNGDNHVQSNSMTVRPLNEQSMLLPHKRRHQEDA